MFNMERKRKGDIHAGVIMERIFNAEECAVFSIGTDKKGEEIKIHLHQGRGEGLGEFVRSWFKRKTKSMIERSGDIQVINKQLTERLENDLVAGEDVNAALKKAVVAKTVADQKDEMQQNFYSYCRECGLAQIEQPKKFWVQDSFLRFFLC